MLRGWLIFALFLTTCDTLDQTDKKRRPVVHVDNSESGQPSQAMDEPVDSNPEEKPPEEKHPPSTTEIPKTTIPRLENPILPVSPDTGCKQAEFSTKLSGNFAKDITVSVFTVHFSGTANLNIDSKADLLQLQFGAENLEVSPALAASSVRSEMEKASGTRLMTPHDKDGVQRLKSLNGVWSDYTCNVVMIKSYVYPYGATTITVDFVPALAFAAYPDQLSSEFMAAATQGIDFAGITATIRDIQGPIPTGMKVGEELTGTVHVKSESEQLKFTYDFGSAINVGKVGLFNSATFSYGAGSINHADIVLPIRQGTDSLIIPLNKP